MSHMLHSASGNFDYDSDTFADRKRIGGGGHDIASPSEEKLRIRKNFVETWIWKSQPAGCV